MDNGASSSEYNESTVQPSEADASRVPLSAEQMLLDYLLETGFAWNEAMKLLHLREHLYEGAEMRQRMAHDCRMHFARWLYEHGELSEG